MNQRKKSAKWLVGIGVAAFIVTMISDVTIREARAADQVIKWKLSSFEPSVSLMAKMEQWWIDEIERKSGGRLKITVYPSEQLCKTKEMLNAVSSGLADVVEVVPAYFPGELPLSTLHYLPYAPPSRCDWAGIVMNKMAGHPLMKKELEKYNAIAAFYHSSKTYDVLSRKPIKTIDDFKGLKIRAAGDQSMLFKMLGATPVSTTAPEVYTAIERGLVDAAPGCGEYWFDNWRILEPLKNGYYIRGVNSGMAGYWVLINKNSFNALPPDIKIIIEGVKWDMPSILHEYTASRPLCEFYLDRFRKAGITITDLPLAEQRKLEAMGTKLAAEWKKRNEKHASGEYYDAYIKEKNAVMKRFPEGLYMDEKPLNPDLASFLSKL